METQTQTRSDMASKLQAQMDDHVSRVKQTAEENVQKMKGLSHQEKVDMAMNAIKSQPGRPTKEIAIKRLMIEKGMTRSQAKTEIKNYDKFLVDQFISQMDNQLLSESVKHVKPMAEAIFAGLNGLARG